MGFSKLLVRFTLHLRSCSKWMRYQRQPRISRLKIARLVMSRLLGLLAFIICLQIFVFGEASDLLAEERKAEGETKSSKTVEVSAQPLPPEADAAFKKGVTAAGEREWALAIKYFEEAQEKAP